jgi:DNA-binding response OmpR family regulator
VSKYKVLVIDYEPRGIQQFAVPLETAGYDVAVEKDGISGMRAFYKIKPDLVIVEAMLPKKNGFEVCQELKKTPQGMKTPIVIVSSVYKGRRYRTQALHHYGCNEYMEKPVESETLLKTVERLVTPAVAVETPEPSAAAVTDDVEAEILSRLDEIMPGDKTTRK